MISRRASAFVPVDDSLRDQQAHTHQQRQRAKDVLRFPYVEFCLWNAMDDMTNFQRNFSTGEVEVHGSAIYHKTEYRERRNHYALYAVNAPIAGFDTDRDSFLGAYGENSAPRWLSPVLPRIPWQAAGLRVGSHHLSVSLAPGESKTFVFVLAYIENPIDQNGSDARGRRDQRAPAEP